MNETRKSFTQAVSETMAAIGFRKRADLIFTMELSADVVGWLGLPTASRHPYEPGSFGVGPVLGVRQQTVERIIAKLRVDKFHQYIPPTVSVQLGYLMPDRRYREWVISPASMSSAATQIAEAVREYGVPFMQEGQDFDRLTILVERHGIDHLARYRRPVLELVAGRAGNAIQLIDDSVASLKGRHDLAAAQFERFAAAFRDYATGGHT
jgi:hypothetical protein